MAQERTLQVEGMHCPSCEKLVASSVMELDGVESAQASHEREELIVTCDESVSNETIAQVVSECGFACKL